MLTILFDRNTILLLRYPLALKAPLARLAIAMR